MFERIGRYIYVIIFSVIALILFITFKVNSGVTKEVKLVAFGDNIKTDYVPFVQNTGIYLSVDTISKLIDENIYYDKLATKVIITTYDKVIKLKIDENKMSDNLEDVSIENPAKVVDGQPYIDINLFKELYGIMVEYNEDTSTVVIDKTKIPDTAIKYNEVRVYSNIDTKSDVLATLNKGDTVKVYIDSLNHNRWYKIKTSSGIIGYISKNNVDYIEEEKSNENENTTTTEENTNEKLTMFWQYGSDLNVLGDKISGVDVVSPTWYELKNSSGEINSEYSSRYYNKAKENGYEIWPIITNGIDSVNYLPADTSAMLNSEYNRENFIKNLVNTLKEDKVDGVNIDFESMKTEDRDMFTQLIRELAPLLRKEGLKLSVDMYFVEYIDRTRIGEASDYVVLMGYDQRGSWSKEAGSIAEISWVEENIKSLIEDSKIPSSKIILGIPFYTRVWIQRQGDSEYTTRAYTMEDCLEFLDEYNLTPTLDEKSGQNYAEVTVGSTTYKLWLEDITSVKKRVETVNKFNLAGITGWRKGYETDDVWQVIEENLGK